MSGALKLFQASSHFVARTVVFMAEDPIFGLPSGKITDIFLRNKVTLDGIHSCYEDSVIRTFSSIKEALVTKKPAQKRFVGFIQEKLHKFFQENKQEASQNKANLIKLCDEICESKNMQRLLKLHDITIVNVEEAFRNIIESSSSPLLPKIIDKGLAAILEGKASEPQFQFIRKSDWIASVMSYHFYQLWFKNPDFNFPRDCIDFAAMQQRLLFIEKQFQSYRQAHNQSKSKHAANKMQKFLEAKNYQRQFLNKQGPILEKLEKFSQQSEKHQSRVEVGSIYVQEDIKEDIKEELFEDISSPIQNEVDEFEGFEDELSSDEVYDIDFSSPPMISSIREKTKKPENFSSEIDVIFDESDSSPGSVEDIVVLDEDSGMDIPSPIRKPVVEADRTFDSSLPEVSLDPVIRSQETKRPITGVIDKKTYGATVLDKDSQGEKPNLNREKFLEVQKNLAPIMSLLSPVIQFNQFFVRQKLTHFKKNFQDAKKCYAEIDDSYSDKAYLANDLGVILTSLFKLSEAREILKSAKKLGSELSSDFLYQVEKNLFLLALQQNKNDKASNHLTRMLRNFEQSNDLYDKDRYNFKKLLGIGSLGISLVCEDTYNKSLVVLHLLWKDAQVEVKEVLSALSACEMSSHASRGAKVYDIAQQRGGPLYVVREFCPGMSLQEYITKKKKTQPPTLEEVLTIAREISLALKALHQARKPVIHNNLKPNNIIFNMKTSKVCLLDGGLRYFYPSLNKMKIAQKQARVGKRETVVESIYISSLYMSPERQKGAIGAACDIFALGKILLFLLTGETSTSDSISTIPEPARVHISGTISRMLHPKVDQRPSAKELAREFDQILAKLTEEEEEEDIFGELLDEAEEDIMQTPLGATNSFEEERDPVALTDEIPIPVLQTKIRAIPVRKKYFMPGFYWQGTEIVCEKDDSVMCYVPEGEFYRGSKDIYAKRDEQPDAKVHLEAYLVDKNLVTWGQYKRFLKETNNWISWRWKMPPLPEWAIEDDHPVVNITWEQAKAYAQWVEKDLLTEAQWEKAAKGGVVLESGISKTANPTPRRSFPWGDDSPNFQGQFRANYCKSKKFGSKSTSPISTFPQGASPYGCMDMSGNVHEWCNDWYESSYYRKKEIKNPKGPKTGKEKCLRGGAFDSVALDLSTTSRHRGMPDMTSPKVGFRCGKTLGKK